jgi:hypothetical protein
MDVGRITIVLGTLLILFGVSYSTGMFKNYLGKLPGDFVFGNERVNIYIPISYLHYSQYLN